MKVVGRILLILIALVAMVVSLLLQDPILYAKRDWLWWVCPVVILFGFLLCLCLKFRVIAVLFVLAGCLNVREEGRYHFQKRHVLKTPDKSLQQIGSRFIVGYSDETFIERLVNKQAIGGVFIASRNVRGKNVQQIRQWIDGLQAIQKQNGLPPLVIACDQEGGLVSRLSPPLPQMKSLAQFAEPLNPEGAYEFGKLQGAQLADCGVTMNFSPVVDLRVDHGENPMDKHSLIARRAVSESPQVVAEITRAYVRGLAESDIISVAKHFPGLGSVREDTHLFPAFLDKGRSQLEQADWLPYQMIGQASVAENFTFGIMMAHVTLSSVGDDRPASISEKTIAIAKHLAGPNSLLVTDDLNMRPVYYRKGGVGRSAQAALDSGVDYVLLSFRGETYYQCAYHLLKARQAAKP